MKVFTTTPFDDLRSVGTLFAELERAGYDGAFTYETKHNPFIPLALAAEHTQQLTLGTAIAIAFARTPMTLANAGWDLQALSRGRFLLGLGSQIRPHIENRYSMPWSKPAARMRELVLGIRAIWASWETGTPLEFEGEFYRHTLMTPAFDPGPNPAEPPPIFVAGVGPRMTAVAGEVADGLIIHPFASRRSLRDLTVPALRRGEDEGGRDPGSVEPVVVCLVATGATGPDLDDAISVVRGQLAFYASTPAYVPVLECHGWERLHQRLNALSKEGRWSEMGDLISDEILETLAVVGRRDEIPALVRAKTKGVSDTVSLECTRRPDPDHFADIVAALRNAP